jgi:hypothetical protein
VSLGADSREKIDKEGEDVEGKDEGDGPFENRGWVVAISARADTECDGESDFD